MMISDMYYETDVDYLEQDRLYNEINQTKQTKEDNMAKITKFHAGMIKASALAVLNAIAKDNYQAVISKSAKLMLLATKLNVKLDDVLPKSVINCIRNLLTKLYVNWIGVNKDLCTLALSVGWGFVTKDNIAVITTLVKLPKLPALR